MSARAKLRLGTRGSELARTQSGTIAAALERLGFAVELTIIKTSGDQNTTSAFASIGPQGVFVREIEQALVERRVELAVHSFKDLPTKSPAELTIAAVPQRVDPADLLLVRRDALARRRADDWLPLETQARASARRRRAGACGSSTFGPISPSSRCAATCRRACAASRKASFDAIVLAAAGVERLQAEQRLGSALADVAVLRLDPARFVPAPAQGALAVQCRRDDARVLAALARLDHAPSRAAVTAERDALARAEGGCDVAFGAYCCRRRTASTS